MLTRHQNYLACFHQVGQHDYFADSLLPDHPPEITDHYFGGTYIYKMFTLVEMIDIRAQRTKTEIFFGRDDRYNRLRTETKIFFFGCKLV